jgi:molybdopterin-guanine dinucleotide biosynthesis protein B
MNTDIPPLVCIVGRSGSGKTTLLEKLIGELRKRGLRVGTIKHHKHDFEMDYPGKDSWRHKQAGSVAALISSPRKIGMVMDADHDYGPEELAPFLSGVALILCEGFKRAKQPKVEVFRSEIHDKPFCIDDDNLIALVTDADEDLGVPRFATSDSAGLASFLIKHFRLEK